MMRIEKITKPAFAVIGRLGTTEDGEGFIARLWQAANEHFPEIEPLVKRSENGMPAGFWGAMSDLSLSFQPWEDGFSKGRYLAGVEVAPDAVAPTGWEKWVSPAYEYLVAQQDGPDAFMRAIKYIAENDMELAGAAYDRVMPGTDGFIFLPVKKI